jgi:hypothetical protein
MAVFDPTRCSCIDKVGTAQVWRGNIPINKNGDFAYHEMVVSLDIEHETSLVDVSVIDNIAGGERDKWLIELGAYGVGVTAFPGGKDIPPQFNQPNWNPARLLGDGVKLKHGKAPGHLVWWQIEGNANPITMGPDPKSYNFIGFIEYLGELRKLDNALIYIHCMNGTDRTGATVAAYAMRYLGMNLDMAMKFANSVPQAGVMNDDYKRLVEAYAEWLKKQ